MPLVNNTTRFYLVFGHVTVIKIYIYIYIYINERTSIHARKSNKKLDPQKYHFNSKKMEPPKARKTRGIYVIPDWSEKPSRGYALEVLKAGVMVDKVPLQKECHLLGRQEDVGGFLFVM